ncbi:MAG TPA: DUF4383 domain-containing protein [Mycobacteriales bacterium]|nr:DUF4383 domain-containing protein [Mycobacteriales bacterium]
MTHGSHEVGRAGARSLNQMLALGFGAVYTLVAVLGFFVAETFAGTGQEENGQIFGLFQVNHLHNLVHLLIGVALIAAAKRHDTARGANLAIGVTYVALAVIGPFLTGTDLNIVALNAPDHWLHLASGLALAGVALAADRGGARTTV